MNEMNRRPVGIDEFPWESFTRPIAYARWNPNFRFAYPELKPLDKIQERLVFESPYLADVTKVVKVKGWPIEIGTSRIG